MRTHLTSFATPEFELSVRRLACSALANGVDETHLWNPGRLGATPFYREHRAILDQRRGAGYWLWKPFIIREALRQAGPGDMVVYADAGITIVRPLEPLFTLCASRGGMLLFAGHYDGIGGRPNVCGAWTKRDAFALLDCDTPRFHGAPMLDAACVVLARTPRALAFVEEWLALCGDPRLLTDAPGTCGLPELPEFVAHRHDQSIASLLAERDGIERFRMPSQFGNHAKRDADREPGEWTRQPYGSSGIYANSPYPTLLFHHRLRRLAVDARTAEHLGPDASLASVLEAFARSLGQAPRVLQLGRDDGIDVPGSPFHMVISDAATPRRVLAELSRLAAPDVLDAHRFLLCWPRLEGIEGWVAFRVLCEALPRELGRRVVMADYGFVAAGGGARSQGDADGIRGIGIVIGGANVYNQPEPSCP